MLDTKKLLEYLDEMIKNTEVEDEFKQENQFKVGANSAYTAVRLLVKRAIEN